MPRSRPNPGGRCVIARPVLWLLLLVGVRAGAVAPPPPPGEAAGGQIGLLEDDGRPADGPTRGPVSAAFSPGPSAPGGDPAPPPAVAAPAQVAGPAGPLAGWAARLAAQSDEFSRSFAAAGGGVAQASEILYAAQNLRAAALDLRRAVADGSGGAQVRYAAQRADAWWRRLDARVRRVAPRRIGPHAQMVASMGQTCEQIRRSLLDLPAAPPGGPMNAGVVPAGFVVEAAGPRPIAPPAAAPAGRPARRPGPVRGILGLLPRRR